MPCHQDSHVSLVNVPPHSSQVPACRVVVMQSGLLPVARSPDSFAPSDQGCARVVGVTIAVISNAAHAVIGREDKGRLAIVAVEVAEEFDRPPHDVIDDADVAVILGSVRAVGVPRCVEAEQVLEEDDPWLAELGVEKRIPTRILQQLFELVEDPEIEVHCVRRKVLGFFVVAQGENAIRITSAELEHGQNVGRAKGERVGRLVEDGVEWDGVLLAVFASARSCKADS